MKIAAAQIGSIRGNIDANVSRHKDVLMKAIELDVNLLLFSELSITGYETTKADQLAVADDDPRWDEFRSLSDQGGISIGVGFPRRTDNGIQIAQMTFRPHQPVDIYAKQHLHKDEWPFFVPGDSAGLIDLQGVLAAPAICYESLLPEHATQAHGMGARIYMASVAKPKDNINRALDYFPNLALKHGMTVVMANSVGPCDGFVAAGNSAIWDEEGILAGQLDEHSEGILVSDTESGEARSYLV